MGTNLFVEGFPSPVVISITFPREVHSFKEIAEITQSLHEVDKTLQNTWPKLWPTYVRHRRYRDVLVLRFRVESPPYMEVLADPAWLAVLVAILVGYKPGKQSVREMMEDASCLIQQMKGLTGRQLQLLHIAVELTLDKLLKLGEDESVKMAGRFNRARKRLTGDDNHRPEVDVKDIDNKYHHW